MSLPPSLQKFGSLLYTSLPLSLQKFGSLALLVYGILLLLLFAKINYRQVKFEYDKKMLGKPSNMVGSSNKVLTLFQRESDIS